MNHSIFRDLIPNYIDGLTSEETNLELEAHMNSCVECRQYYQEMAESIELEEQKSVSVDYQQFDHLKKIKRKSLKRILLAIISLIAVFTCFITAFIIYSEMWLPNSDDISMNIKKVNNTATIKIELKNKKHLVIANDVNSSKNQNDNYFIIYEMRKVLNDPPSITSKTEISYEFLDKDKVRFKNGAIKNLKNGEGITLKFKDKERFISFKELYNTKEN